MSRSCKLDVRLMSLWGVAQGMYVDMYARCGHMEEIFFLKEENFVKEDEGFWE